MFHAPMVATAPALDLAVVWARRREAADELARRFGATAVDDLDDLLDRCDVVVFAVPPDVQADLAVRAAEAGRHLLLEKPIATTLPDAEGLAAAVERAGVRSQLVLTIRYRAEVREFLAGLTGRAVDYVRGSMISAGALAGSPFSTPWRREAGAELLDVGPHTLDLLEAVAGPVVELRGAQRHGLTTVATTHAGGAIGHAVLSITTPDGPGGLDVEVVTQAGFATMPTAPADEAQVWRTITDELAATVAGQPHPLDVHHGLRLQRLLDAVARSVATNGPITV
jgi:predicted dehydrogenase